MARRKYNLKLLNLKPLYLWYRKNKRDLPFRKTCDPYKIWVSETMLQQTRVAAILPSYTKFLDRFPNIKSLAKATQEEVLRYWQGLGYYNRARNLHRGATYILEQCQGKIPRELPSLLQVPGIGPYTAAAILSLSYNKPLAVVDGNVKRVLARLYHIADLSSEELIQALAEKLMQRRGKASPSEHNQALMEFGAMICIPKTPRCSHCVLRQNCRSHQLGGSELAAQIPTVIKKRFLSVQLKLWIIVCPRPNRLLLVKESNSRFFKDLWFLPYHFAKNTPFSPKASTGFPDILQKLPIRKQHAFSRQISHSITHHKITAQVEAIWLSSAMPVHKSPKSLSRTPKATALIDILSVSPMDDNPSQWQWIELRQAENYLVTSLGRKSLQMFLELSR